MTKLFSANLARLRRDILFIFCTASMFIFGIVSTVIVNRENDALLHNDTADNVFGGYIMPVCILLAFICCDFFGVEFKGTIRNKLNVGYTRVQVYAAQYLSCLAAGAILSIAFLLPAVILGEILLGGFKTSLSALFSYFICGTALTAACVSLYCLLMAIAARKSSGTALTVFIMLLTMWAGRQVEIFLNLPAKTHHPIEENGEITFAYIDNPRYPTGIKRTILEYVYDILPSTQSLQIKYFPQNSVPMGHALRLALFSVIIALIAFVLGAKIFEKKDLK